MPICREKSWTPGFEPGTSTRITPAPDPRQQEFPAYLRFSSQRNGNSGSRILAGIPGDWAQISRSCPIGMWAGHWSQWMRSEEHTSELQSRLHLVCRLLLEKKKQRSFAAPRVGIMTEVCY